MVKTEFGFGEDCQRYYNQEIQKVNAAQNYVRGWLTKRRIKKIKEDAKLVNLDEVPEDPDLDNLFFLGEGQVDYI